jgi:hypothetical protein
MNQPAEGRARTPLRVVAPKAAHPLPQLRRAAECAPYLELTHF